MLRLPGFLQYISETGRNRNKRLTKHKQATKNGEWQKWPKNGEWRKMANNHIAVHHQLTSHNIDQDSAECLFYSINYFQQLTLESWYTNLEQMLLCRCQQLPEHYKQLYTTRQIETDQ